MKKQKFKLNESMKEVKKEKHLDDFKPLIHVDIHSEKILFDNRAAFLWTSYAKA